MRRISLAFVGMVLCSPALAQLQNAGSNAANIAASQAQSAGTSIATSVASQITGGLLGGSSAHLPAPTIQLDTSPCPDGCDCTEDQIARQAQQNARQQAVNHYHSITSVTGDLGALNCLDSIMVALSAVNPGLPSASAIIDTIMNGITKAVCGIAQAEWSAVTSEALAAGEDYASQTVGGQAGGMAASAVGQAGSAALHPSSNSNGQIYSIGDPTGAAAGTNSASVRGAGAYSPTSPSSSSSPAAAANLLFGNGNP